MVWLPSASGAMPAATAAAEPLDEPPGVCAGFHGLTVGPGWRQANSVVTVLPSTVPPRSEEHTSELQSLMRISYAVFCLKKKKKNPDAHTEINEAPKVKCSTHT